MQHQLRQNPTSFADGESKEIAIPQNSDNTASTNSTAQTPGTHLIRLDAEMGRILGIFYEQELARVEKSVEEEQFIVDRVIKSKGRGANKQVLVSWRGYPSKFDSWIPASSLISLHDGGGTISSGTSE
ncbi:hypothetical protein ALC57_01459 [Trachymyrmex cornetzi]|uniref:Chromo domain-containing protein n=1 Tax=Trachymyrmex cornetzi TaxID=471704 RepID=A0A151JQ73_9HYME|nr:hypothetical protein ALC57_01459 [Trachymyrmex cornetzi]